MRKDFINEVARIQRIKRADLIEKDIILHQMLSDLSKNKFFSDKFAFKGGTCLAKCYLDYFRFSEDIDFTWKDQSVFDDKSQKEVRAYLSKIIDDIGLIFEEIAKKRGLDFCCEKHNKEYVELGGGNKTCTFKVWYRSEVTGARSFVKVQMNFVERLYFPIRQAKLGSLLSEKQKEILLLFPESEDYLQRIGFDVYDMREILCEKIRAILTRRGVKVRDFLDVYMICKNLGIKLEDMHDCALGKTRFMFQLYKKYRENLDEKRDLLLSFPFAWGEEKGLLLQEIDEKDFFRFLKELKQFLSKIINELENKK